MLVIQTMEDSQWSTGVTLHKADGLKRSKAELHLKRDQRSQISAGIPDFKAQE